MRKRPGTSGVGQDDSSPNSGPWYTVAGGVRLRRRLSLESRYVVDVLGSRGGQGIVNS